MAERGAQLDGGISLRPVMRYSMLPGMYRDAQKVVFASELETPAIPADGVQLLVENRTNFLGFVQRLVGDRDTAEDILQESLARGIARLASVRNGELIVVWFYRVLRNAVLDHHRRRMATSRGLEALAKDFEGKQVVHDDAPASICKCVGHLVTKLKPEYAEALQRIEVDGLTVRKFAQERGLSSGNAGVRVFRAREALRRAVVASCGSCVTNGCRDCSCGEHNPQVEGAR